MARQESARLPIGMVGATTAIVAVGLLLTVAGGPIYAVAAKAGASLSDRSIYVNAVLGSGAPAPPGSGAPGESGTGIDSGTGTGAADEPRSQAP